jgi:hypothetical protein
MTAATAQAAARPTELSSELREYYALEYERIAGELIDNEAMGEGRVTLYLGVWSAVMAAMAGLASIASDGKPLHPDLISVALVGLAVVLALGAATAVRIARRNYVTDGLVDALCRLRSLIRPREAHLNVLPWPDELVIRNERPWALHVGLLQVVGLANAALPAMGVLLLVPKGAPMLWSMLLATLLSLAIQMRIARKYNRRDYLERQQKHSAFLAQFGLGD